MNKHHLNKTYSEDNSIATIYNQTNNLLDCVLRCVIYKDDIDSSWIEEINDICIHIFNITREIKDNNLRSNIFKHFLLPTTTIEDYFEKITTFQYKNAQNNRYPEFKRKCIDARRFIIVYLLFVNELVNIANDENPKIDFKYSFNKCFELMDITDVSKYGLSDIAYGLTFAMDMCFELGEEFIAHFDKICKSNSKNTLYISSQKMQRLFDIVKSINLRYNRKKINEKQLYDWFITIGKLPLDLFDNNDEADKYDELANKLLDQNITLFYFDLFNISSGSYSGKDIIIDFTNSEIKDLKDELKEVNSRQDILPHFRTYIESSLLETYTDKIIFVKLVKSLGIDFYNPITRKYDGKMIYHHIENDEVSDLFNDKLRLDYDFADILNEDDIDEKLKLLYNMVESDISYSIFVREYNVILRYARQIDELEMVERNRMGKFKFIIDDDLNEIVITNKLSLKEKIYEDPNI